MARSDLAPMGSIADISARLLLWSKRGDRGLARVEFSSEFSRQQVVDYLRNELTERQILFAEIHLPTYREPMEIVDYLLAELDKQPSGVVSINGFSTAFRAGVPLQDAMLALNFNRERFADRPLSQIWWMTPIFYDAAQFAMPDLMSWFSPRLRLTEAVVVEPQELMMTGGTANIDDARQRAEYLIQRFEQGTQAGAPAEDLLRLYLLPALEALSEVNAQKDLQDLTSRFEGFLSHLKSADSPELVDSLNHLGLLYFKQGRYVEAEPLVQRTLSLRRKLLGENHQDVASSLNNLALLYLYQGQGKKAEPLFKESLKLSHYNLDTNDFIVSRSLNNLASLYKSQGRYAEAELHYKQALELDSRIFGKEHLAVATGLNNLATLYQIQSRYEEAEALLNQSLKLQRDLIGEEHPSVATTLNNLGILYESQGRYEEAGQILQQSLELRSRLLGENHPDVAISLSSLALLKKVQKSYVEAESLYLRSLSISEQQLGQDHLNVAIILNNLAKLYRAQRRYSEAEKLYLRSLFILSQGLRLDHPNVIKVKQDFINFLAQLLDEGEQSALSNDPLVQELIAQIQEERSPQPNPPST